MTSPTNLTLTTVLLALLGLTGCFSLSRDAPAIQHYVLGSVPSANGVSTSDASAATIGLRQPRLADYLDIPFIVVRQGTNRITYSDFYRWGESLAGGINGAVAARLVESGNFESVNVAPWPAQTGHDYQISIHITRFEGVVEDSLATRGEVHVRASWEISSPGGTTAISQGTTDFRRPGWSPGNYESLVMMLDAGLSQLAADLITRLGSLEAG